MRLENIRRYLGIMFIAGELVLGNLFLCVGYQMDRDMEKIEINLANLEKKMVETRLKVYELEREVNDLR